jgi:hypothetical protein
MLSNINHYVTHQEPTGVRINLLNLTRNKLLYISTSIRCNPKPINNHDYQIWLNDRRQRFDFSQNNWFLLATTNLFDIPYTKLHKYYWPFKLKSDLIKHNWGTDRWLVWRKEIYNSYSIVLTHSKYKMVYSGKIRYSLNSRGLPKTYGLAKILKYAKGDQKVTYIRAFLSLLREYEITRTPVSYDVSTILHTWKGDLSWFPAKSVVESLNYEKFVIKKIDGKEFWFDSPSGGPNGSPSWQYWWKDSIAIKNEQQYQLKENLLYFSNLYQIEFWKHLEDAAAHGIKTDEYAKRKEEYVHSRLSFLQDKAGKTRVVAMVDLYTQSCLKPIHQYFASQNRKNNPCDFTHDQDSGRLRVLEFCKRGGMVYSFDLKSASDMMPSELVDKCARELLGFELSRKWISLMVDRDFTYFERVRYYDTMESSNKKWKSRAIHRVVRYGTGVPMGLLSCFPGALAFTHHCIVQASALQAGVNLPFRDYALLGDDIVIYNGKVAKEYQEIISKLGMVISKHKSIVGLSSAEFAKTLISRSEIVTPLPWSLIDKARLYPGFLLQLLRDLKMRYALAEVKLNKLIKLLPFSKRKDGIIILTCFAVTKVRVNVRINSSKLEENSKIVIMEDIVKDPVLLKLLTDWNNPDPSEKEKFIYVLRMKSFSDFFKNTFKKQEIHNKINEAQWKSYPWKRGHSGVLPYSSVYHHYKKLQSLIHQTLVSEVPSSNLLRLMGTLGDQGLENDDLSYILDRVLTGFILGQSFTKSKEKTRKFSKHDECYRMVGTTILRLFRTSNIINKKAKVSKLGLKRKTHFVEQGLIVPNELYVRLIK